MDVFLDKHILFRYARALMFDRRIPKKQAQLVLDILKGEHTAFISSNTPFALLNHLKYRAQDKYGLNKSLKEADVIAKSYFNKIFGKGKWKLVNLSLKDYEMASLDKTHEWEDAVQYQCVVNSGKPFATDNIKDFEKDDEIELMPVR